MLAAAHLLELALEGPWAGQRAFRMARALTDLLLEVADLLVQLLRARVCSSAASWGGRDLPP